MSVGPLGGIAASAAGSPRAQAKGSDVERAQQDAASQQRRIQTDQKAEDAAGIGEADGEDHEAADRDADGRRLWEDPPQRNDTHAQEGDPHESAPPRSKDITGRTGNLLDLTG